MSAEADVQSSLVDKIEASKDFTGAEKLCMLGALMSIDRRKFFGVMVQAYAPTVAATLVAKSSRQQTGKPHRKPAA